MEYRKSSLDMLNRLKSQQNRPNPLAVEKNPFGKQENPVRQDNLSKEAARYERILKDLEAIENKVKDGNYLNYYHQMNEKQKEYLLETEKIDSDIERISPILYRRLFAKREQLLKNKRLL